MANKIGRIEYVAADGSMGECSPEECDRFRDWAQKEIERDWSIYDVSVVNDEIRVSRVVPYDGSTKEDQEKVAVEADYILDYLCRLWDRYPLN